MMASSKRNIFRVTGPLCGEFTTYRWIPSTKAGDAQLWRFLWSAPDPRHTGRRPRCDHGDLGNPPDRRVVAGAALARRSDARTLWAQLPFYYDVCVRATFIPRPHGAHDTRSVRPSATISDQNANLQRCYNGLSDRTTLLASIAHTRHPYDDPTATIGVSLYIWLHSMAC